MKDGGLRAWSRALDWLVRRPNCPSYSHLKGSPNVDHAVDALQQSFKDGRLRAEYSDLAFRKVARRIMASRILFVPGAIGRSKDSSFRVKQDAELAEQVRELKSEGFEAEIAQVDAHASVDHNGRVLARLLEQRHCPTWIVTYSKGGLDTLEALVSFPEVRRFVEGWIAFQSPFYGSPVADVAGGRTGSRQINGAAMRVMGANLQAVSDLNTAARSQYMDRNALRIAQLARDVPVMCVGSVLQSLRWQTGRWPTGRWMNDLGLGNDGVVPLNSTMLPEARFLKVEGWAHGHMSPRQLLVPNQYAHCDVLKALFAFMLGERQKRLEVAA